MSAQLKRVAALMGVTEAEALRLIIKGHPDDDDYDWDAHVDSDEDDYDDRNQNQTWMADSKVKEGDTFPLGTRVLLSGLSAVAYNGQQATIVAAKSERGRYGVMLEKTGERVSVLAAKMAHVHEGGRGTKRAHASQECSDAEAMAEAKNVFVRAGDATAISGDASTITQQRDEASLSLTNIVADATTGPVYAEFRVLSPNEYGSVTAKLGAVVQEEGLDLNMDPVKYIDNHGSYFNWLANGSCYGAGKHNTDVQGGGDVNVGDRVGVLVKTGEQGFVRFFHNGEELGPGFRPGEDIKIPGYYGRQESTGAVLGPIKSPLVIAVSMSAQHHSFELLPNAAVPVAASRPQGSNKKEVSPFYTYRLPPADY